MGALFWNFQFVTYSELLAELSPVRFPTSEYVTPYQVLDLKREIRHNANVLLDHVHAGLRYGMLSEEHIQLLNQLRRDCYDVRDQCSKARVNFLRPRRQHFVAPLRASYQDMKIGAILLCQQEEPALMDSLAEALG